MDTSRNSFFNNIYNIMTKYIKFKENVKKKLDNKNNIENSDLIYIMILSSLINNSELIKIIEILLTHTTKKNINIIDIITNFKPSEWDENINILLYQEFIKTLNNPTQKNICKFIVIMVLIYNKKYPRSDNMIELLTDHIVHIINTYINVCINKIKDRQRTFDEYYKMKTLLMEKLIILDISTKKIDIILDEIERIILYK